MVEAARLVVMATGVEVQWDVQEVGLRAFEGTGEVLPARPPSIRGDRRRPEGSDRDAPGSRRRQRQRRVASRAGPLREHPALPALSGCAVGLREVDLVVVRENTEDIYTGVEFEVGTAEVRS